MYDILCVFYIYVLQGVMGNTSKNKNRRMENGQTKIYSAYEIKHTLTSPKGFLGITFTRNQSLLACRFTTNLR